MTFWVAGAAIGGSVLGGVLSSKASGKAADTQAAAATQASADSLAASREANALQKEMYYKNLEMNQPFREGGLTAQNQLMFLLGLQPKTGQEWYNGVQVGGFDRSKEPDYGSLMKDFSAEDFKTDPGYQWRLDQGLQALQRSASAKGGLLSGGAMKDAMNYNQGAASQEYGNAYNRYQTNRMNKLNPLQSLAGVGQSVSNTMGNAGSQYGSNVGANTMNTANNVGNNTMAAGNANASGYVGGANALNSALGQGTNQLMNYNMMNKLFPTTGATAGGSAIGGYGTTGLNNFYFGNGTGGD